MQKDPVLTTDETGAAEGLYVNPGAIIRAGDTLHMFANVFSGWPDVVSVVHLTSNDGLRWTHEGPAPLFTTDQLSTEEPDADVSTGFVDAGGAWVLLYEIVSKTTPWYIGRLTASSPDGPWKVDGGPVVTPGGAGSADLGGVGWPSVVVGSNGYLMYFEGMLGFELPNVIEMASSPDGKTWTKRGEPVLVADRDWEGGAVARPRVVAVPGGFLMVYASADLSSRGIAWSKDGVTWTKDGSIPAITRGMFPVAGTPYDAALTTDGHIATYYLEIGSGRSGTSDYAAKAVLPTAVP